MSGQAGRGIDHGESRGLRLDVVYVATVALLATHEIDSAYWHEWTLFRVPGGIGVFLALNLGLLIPFLWGVVEVARRPARGAWYGVAAAVAGTAAFTIHTAFLWQGSGAFRTAASLSILAATLAASIGLLAVSIRELRRAGGSETDAGEASNH
jgi:hypothetical protein